MMDDSHQRRLFTLAGTLDQYAKQYEMAHDSRAVFTRTYASITRTLATGFTQVGFENPDWVVALAETFAAHYLSALDSFDRNAETPKAWAEVFRVLKLKTTSVLEDLVFGMTAHIVNDLPLALVDVNLVDSRQVSHIGDFHRMNDGE